MKRYCTIAEVRLLPSDIAPRMNVFLFTLQMNFRNTLAKDMKCEARRVSETFRALPFETERASSQPWSCYLPTGTIS
jgi:hypothetical protein